MIYIVCDERDVYYMLFIGIRTLFDRVTRGDKVLWAGFIRKRERDVLTEVVKREAEVVEVVDWVWCLLFVLIRHGFRGGSGPQRLIGAYFLY